MTGVEATAGVEWAGLGAWLLSEGAEEAGVVTGAAVDGTLAGAGVVL